MLSKQLNWDSDVKITANVQYGYANWWSCMGHNAGTLSEIHAKADQDFRAERLFCSHGAVTSFRMLLQMVDTLNTLFKYTERAIGNWHAWHFRTDDEKQCKV